jgi:hypothetical protein
MARSLISAGQPSAGGGRRHYALERAQFVRWVWTGRDTLLRGQLGPNDSRALGAMTPWPFRAPN